MTNDWWKYGLSLGLGLSIGAIGAVLISRNPGAIKKACVSVLSHAMDVKEKTVTAVETAKENMEDMLAEARHDLNERHKTAGGPEAGAEA